MSKCSLNYHDIWRKLDSLEDKKQQLKFFCEIEVILEPKLKLVVQKMFETWIHFL